MSELTIKKYKLESLADLGKTNTSIIECINSMVETDEPTRYTVKLILSELIINGFIHGKAEELNLEIAIDARITSYNVCYTKLLRCSQDTGHCFGIFKKRTKQRD